MSTPLRAEPAAVQAAEPIPTPEPIPVATPAPAPEPVYDPSVPLNGPARADTNLKAAENLEKLGKKPHAIAFYGQVVKDYYGTTQALEAARRIRRLGGEVPLVAEFNRWRPPSVTTKTPVGGASTPTTTSGEPTTPKASRSMWTYRDAPAFSSGPRYSAPSGPRSVHVRSYVRKDGTFVHSHTRRAPRR